MGPSNRSARFVLVSTSVALALLLFPSRATVQDAQPYDDPSSRDFSQDVPAHFTVVEGQVMLERDAKLEPAEPNQIVMAGDRLRTTTGRTEILFPDGSTLQVDENTEIDFLSDSLMRLGDGRVRFNIKRATDKLDYRIDTAPGHVEIRAAGDYRIGIGADKRGKAEVDLTVFRGTADLVNENGRTSVRPGKHAVTSADTEPSLPYAFNSASQDEFDQWVQGLRDAQVVSASSPSAQNLPQEVSYYSNTMDSYGSWANEEPYGQVWYPTVAVGWYPYSQGRWGYSKHYSYTWLGLDHWAWPTYHYGSWGLSSVGWYWVPGYAYAPAWVTWGYAPGYVGWCPVGPRGGPVYDWNGWIGGRYPSQHHGPWTVMAAGSMGHNTWVSEKAIRPEAMPLNARAAFTEGRGAPVPTGSAMARRDVAAIGSPTVPRGGANARVAATGTNVALTNATPATSRGAASNRPSNQSSAALSGFPPAGRTAVSMPDSTRGGGNSGAAIRAVPRGVESPEANGLPSTRSSFPDATRSATRAEISGRVDTRGADGFPSSGAVRAVPRGLEGPTGAPAMRAEPGPNSAAGSNRSAIRTDIGSSGASGSRGADGSGTSSGYRAVPQGLQSAPPVNRGRTVQAPPTTAAPPMAPASRSMPAMSGAIRSAPMVAAPPTSAPQQAAPRGHSVSPAAAPASAPPPAASAPPQRGAASTATTGTASQGSATARRGAGRGGL